MAVNTRKSADRWGPADELGALNVQQPETVKRALSSVTTGTVYSLGLPIRRSGVPHVQYRPVPQRLTLLNHTDEKMLEPYGGQPGTGSHEDLVIVASHESTHMDALGHVYQNGATYNGWPSDDSPTYEGLSKCGIEKAGPIVGRGILLDVASLYEDKLPPGYIITVEDLQSVMRQHKIELRPADIVLIRTGWVGTFSEPADMDDAQPGIGLAAAKFLADHDIVAVGSDNSAIEAMPFDGGTFMPVHIELLVERGIFLIEHLVLDNLATDQCREFLFVCTPLSIVGASGSPVNPIAIA